MSILSKLNTASDLKATSDSLGGGGYVWESGLYQVMVDLAYSTTADSGAVGLNLVFKDADARELKIILWVQSGNAKGNKTYYEKDGVKYGLPGYNQANALALLTVGKELTALDAEEKVVKIWDYAASAEVNTKVEVYTELIGQRIDIGVIKQIVNKNEKGDDGIFRPTSTTRDENEIDKMFRADDGLTVTEIQAGDTEAKFHDAWKKKWTGVTRDKVKKVAGSGAVAGTPATAATATKTLFPTN